jgi:hypothetical protein
MRNRWFALLIGVALAMVSTSSAFADTGGGGGSDLGLDAVTISAGSVVSKTGVVTLTGSIACSQDLEASVFADVAQPVGRFKTVRGFGFVSVSCLAADGSADFTLAVFADQGKFAAGTVRVSANAETGFCDVSGDPCFFDSVSFGPESIRLRR